LKGNVLEHDPVALEKLLAFRDKVKCAKLVKFYRNADDLKSQVWQALTHSISMHPMEGWVRGRNQRRMEDLEEINRLLRRTEELEAELTQLKEAEAMRPEKLLAHGSEEASWSVRLESKQSDKWEPFQISLSKHRGTSCWQNFFLLEIR
jgi:hypothetical protein